MKKIIFILMTLIFVLISASCSYDFIPDLPETTSSSETTSSAETTSRVAEDEIDYDSYKVRLGPYSAESSISSSIFTIPTDNFDYTILKTENVEKSIHENISIGKKTLSAKLIKIETHSVYGNKKIYVSQNDSVKFWKYDGFDYFGIDAEDDEIISEYSKSSLTEIDFINHVDLFLSSYLNLADYTDYNKNITTRIGVDIENAYWAEDRNGFHKAISNNENDSVSYYREEVLSYEVEYVKECKGIRTPDRILVRCDERGNITYFLYCNYGVDWSSFDLNYVDANNLVDYYIPQIINTGYCELVDYEITHMTLSYENGKVILVVNVGLDLILRDPDFGDQPMSHLCLIRFFTS